MATDVTERRRLMRDLVQDVGEVDFASLAARFQISEMTARRDVDVLEAEGLVRKVMGGAIATGKFVEPSFETRMGASSSGKQAIGDAVAALLHTRETVILDSGSTALAVARAVRGRRLELTVVTPSVQVAVELSDEPGTTVILTGGTIRPGELSLIGDDAVSALRRYNCDTYVMGVSGVHPTRGYSDYHREETAVKRAAIEAADRLIVVADRTKLGRAHLAQVAPLDAADLLVTDADPESDVVRTVRAAGVRTVCADHENP
ncbi:DeoR/GlpR family DNA-binding transcription regulator [Nocardiopsis tropica]|uniref:DeoR/GlpR family DNA-binding transcription regulator n=2 Tax=Tsukamurella strandjordii TaxID=147577 RepID=A0AA90S7D7_9ACTN|nr:DeoR/GlpR family DNA-binding transcription regulator [Tsukamurella strandjordii]MDP0397115.1 DeoR/GlpR family DNA-binding transcription regulator [Tsukamurella strandjordii]